MTINDSAPRIVGYCRCSTAEQASDGMSLDAQENRIRAWADAVGAEITEMVTDAAVSGSKRLADRPGGQKIATLLDARNPKVDAVAVLRLDRLGRDAAESLALLKRFRTGKLGLVSVVERIDLATPHGRAMAGVSLVFAELERSLIAQRTADALTELKRQGRAWNHAPLGWEIVNGTLVPVPDEQDTLSLMRSLRSQGTSYARIAAHLTNAGRRTKKGGRWAATTLRSALNAQPAPYAEVCA